MTLLRRLDHAITRIVMDSRKSWFCATVGELQRFCKHRNYPRTLHYLHLAATEFLNEHTEAGAVADEIENEAV